MSSEKPLDHNQELHIGLLVLATDPTPEIEFRQMLNGDNVAFFVNRVYYENPVTVENLRAMGDDLTRATSHILPESRLDVVAYGCTSGTAAIGADQTIEYMQRARPGVACTTPLIAACKGFNKLGVHRIALITPYKTEVDDLIKTYFEEQNISVVKSISFDLESDVEIARLPASSIYEAACEINNSEVEGVFISCTALRAAETIKAIEEEIGKPVITSNQALLWDALRLGGYNEIIHGYGELMEI